MYSSIITYVNTICKSKITKHRKKMVNIFKQLKEIFSGSKRNNKTYFKTGDKTDDKTDDDKTDDDETDYDEANDEKPNTTDMPALESEESAEQRRNQTGQGQKILTPDQMLSRLPISLAQLQAGNNSEKLKNEIRQLLYSLYRSKNLTKTIYKHLINFI